MTIKNLLVLAFLFGSYFGFGQFTSAKVLTSCNIVCQPHDLTTGDLDSDGNIDIFLVDEVKKSFIWLKNEGDGTFTDQTFFTTHLIYHNTNVLKDIDKDGDIDIISAFAEGGSEDGRIIIFYNDGLGNFTPTILLEGHTFGYAVLDVVDLDSDGDYDIISEADGTYNIAWYENDGEGNFLSANTISNRGRNFSSVVKSSDLDNDGDMDIVVGTSGNTENIVFWYENDGEENFSSQKIITKISRAIDLEIVDLDNDNRVDILISSPGFDIEEIRWFSNIGDGNFSEKRLEYIRFEAPFSYFQPERNIAIDWDQDGDQDIFSSSIGETGIIYFENEGNGIFALPKVFNTNVADAILFHADLDGDQLEDILSASPSNSELVWFKNNRHLGASEKRIIETTHLNNVIAASSYDFDNDGDQDIIFESDEKLAWWENIGDNSFSTEHTIKVLEDPSFLRIRKVIDLDLDSDYDVLYAEHYSNGIIWYENKGEGNFVPKKEIFKSFRHIVDFEVIDLNGDGHLDLLFIIVDRLVWLEGNGEGDFSDEKEIDYRLRNTSNFGLADIDSDNDIDIISAIGNYTIGIYRNDGLGNFGDMERFLVEEPRVRKVNMIDLDNDGDKDLISIDYYANRASWYENENGQFGSRHELDYNVANSSFFDIDKDNDFDAISQYNDNDEIAWYENNGNGSFGKKNIISKIEHLSSLSISDIDDDGDVDLLTTIEPEDKISWYENIINYQLISGQSYWDENYNGLFDSLEQSLYNQQVFLTPNAISSYTDANGIYRFYVPNGTYTLSVQPDSCYQLTTDSLSYTVTIDGGVALNKNFGFQLASDYRHTQTRINSAATRCGFDVPFTVSVQNDGCVPSKGQYGLVLDSLVTLVEAAIEPSEIRGDTLLWNYEELFSTQSENIKLTFQIAGTEFLGDLIHLRGLSYIENEAGELELSSTYDYHSEIRCAYDPNDKLVYPNRLRDYDKNYTLFEEELEYTVRFQNTGTDTAFTVVIKDYLDPNLNWKTFKPVVSSHSHETLLHSDGLVEFTFRNILLPDSTTNEPLSHGFVTYKIKPNADLEENTNIENTANIFFDFNPPIQTNTTSNILVEELPKTTSTRGISKTGFPVKVYPNPFKEMLTFELEQFQPITLEIFDARGQLIRQTIIQNSVHQEAVTNLPNGLYFYRLLNQKEQQILTSGRIVKQ